MVPARGEGTSTTALSVSMSARMSCSLTAWPTCTRHLMSSASCTPSPRSGRMKSLGLAVALAWAMKNRPGKKRGRKAECPAESVVAHFAAGHGKDRGDIVLLFGGETGLEDGP